MSEREHNAAGGDDAEAAQTNLGEMLRKAREMRDLSVEDLARRLRLAPRIVHDLERNQFDQIAAPAFIRGYIRSIAKELDVDSTPMIAVFDLRTLGEAPPLADFQSRAPAQITVDSNVIRYTSAGLVLVMLVLMVSWWRAHDSAPPAGPQPEEGGDVAATEPLTYDFDIVTHSEAPFYRAPPPAPAAPASTTAAAGTVAADDGDAAPGTDPETAAPDGTPAAEPAADELLITTTEDAWIEVRDAGGERLHFGLARPDRAVRLGGVPPFTLIIGNAPAVAVSYGGVAVAFDAFMREGVARFQLASPQPSAIAERPGE